MDANELRTAWQSLERRMARSEQLQRAVLHEARIARVRAHLRPMKIGHWLQAALGAGLIALGVACWTRNTDVAGLLLAGLVVHAFGLLTLIAAGVILAQAARVDYAAPVLVIQRRLAQLLRAHALNAAVCAAPWWIMWLPVVVACAGLGNVSPGTRTPAWIAWSLAIGGVGLAATWWHGWRRYVRRTGTPPPADAAPGCADGSDGIRRSQRLLAELTEFEAG